jgi:hypothetical protein
VPPQWKNKKIGLLTEKLQNKGLEWRLSELGDKKDFDQFFNDCEELMMLIDKELGLKPIKATWN